MKADSDNSGASIAHNNLQPKNLSRKTKTPMQEKLKKESHAYSLKMGKIIRTTRRKEKITQEELAARIGKAGKSYISKIENGVIEPTIGTFCCIIHALGWRVNIVQGDK